MDKFLFLLSIFFICLPIYAETVTNVDANQEGKKIVITYDLDCTADISVEYSIDNGRTFKPLHYVTGDVGCGVKYGNNTIVWDVLAELEQLQSDVSFRVNATNVKPAPFLGINIGVGGNFGKGFSIFNGILGLDIAGSINNCFAMGCYFSYKTISSVSLGLLFIHNFNNASAFIWGIGYTTPEYILKNRDNYEYDNLKISPNFRLSYKLKNGLYFSTDMEVSKNTFYGEHANCKNHDSHIFYKRSSFDINFRIGYKFKLNKKKN